jgi:hypothetical protein
MTSSVLILSGLPAELRLLCASSEHLHGLGPHVQRPVCPVAHHDLLHGRHYVPAVQLVCTGLIQLVEFTVAPVCLL